MIDFILQLLSCISRESTKWYKSDKFSTHVTCHKWYCAANIIFFTDNSFAVVLHTFICKVCKHESLTCILLWFYFFAPCLLASQVSICVPIATRAALSTCDCILAINIYQRDSSGFTDALQFYEPLDCSSDNKCLLYHDDGGPEGEVSQAAEETCHHRRGSWYAGQRDKQSRVVSNNYSTESSDQLLWALYEWKSVSAAAKLQVSVWQGICSLDKAGGGLRPLGNCLFIFWQLSKLLDQ